MAKLLGLIGLLIICAFLENLGDAGGYLTRKPAQQFLLSMSAMALYGAIAVVIACGGWSFTEAFPIWYVFAYKLVGWGFAAYIEGPKITRWDVIGGALILLGLSVSLIGFFQRH